MTLHLYDTASKTIKPLVAPPDKPLRMYTCGPTVYNFAHIGNWRTFLFSDVLRRTLHYFGVDVLQVMNLTDVDDKTIRGALEHKMPLKAYTDQYIAAFLEDLQTLNMQVPEQMPRATEFMPFMIELIAGLMDRGAAYAKEGNVFFRIAAFKDYGKLSHICLEHNETGASNRVTADEYEKEHASDFVLWKAYDAARDGDIYWEAPWGKGRPGWHTECSAMAMEILGETIELHVGGVDLVFPHHENEIAQSETMTNKPFALHWAHAEHLMVEGKKMSKSAGNFYTLRDLLDKGYTGPQIRFLLIQSHYRTSHNFTLEGLQAAQNSLDRLSDFIYRLRHLPDIETTAAITLLTEAHNAFDKAIGEDLNTSQALGVLFDFVRNINTLIDDEALGASEGAQVLSLLQTFDRILGVLPLEENAQTMDPALLEALQKRNAARKAKDWETADAMRDWIAQAGYVIEDTPQGARLKPCKK